MVIWGTAAGNINLCDTGWLKETLILSNMPRIQLFDIPYNKPTNRQSLLLWTINEVCPELCGQLSEMQGRWERLSIPSFIVHSVQCGSSEPVIMQSQGNQIPLPLRKQVTHTSTATMWHSDQLKALSCNIKLPDFPLLLKASKPHLTRQCKEVLAFPTIGYMILAAIDKLPEDK